VHDEGFLPQSSAILSVAMDEEVVSSCDAERYRVQRQDKLRHPSASGAKHQPGRVFPITRENAALHTAV